MRRSLRAPVLALLAGALGALAGPPGSRADDVGKEGVIEIPQRQPSPWDSIDDPVIRDMLALDAIAPFEDMAPLWKWKDKKLQNAVIFSWLETRQP